MQRHIFFCEGRENFGPLKTTHSFILSESVLHFKLSSLSNVSFSIYVKFGSFTVPERLDELLLLATASSAPFLYCTCGEGTTSISSVIHNILWQNILVSRLAVKESLTVVTNMHISII